MLTYREIARIFEEIELRLIQSLKRNLSRHRQEEQQEKFQWSAWQAEKLKSIEQFRRENRSIMNEYVDIIDSETRELMQEQFTEGQQLAEDEAKNINASSHVPDSHFFGVNHNKMQHLMDDITTIEKNVETAALRTMDDVYRQTLNRVQLEMATGSMSINQAVDEAVRDFLSQGINCIVYRDGRRVNIADYVRMALRTTSTRATLQGKASRYAEMGYDTVLVSEYGMCSETCLPWQGKVYIDDVFTDWDGVRHGDSGVSKYCGKEFPLLSVAMKGGLFHPNCRHTISLWIEGHSKLPEPMDAEKIKERSKAEQKQRALEREVRKRKREVLGLSDEAAVRLAKQKLKQAQAKLKAHIDENDFLRRDYGREKIYDVPQSSAADQQLNTLETLPNVQIEGHTAEVDAPVPQHSYPEDSKTYVDKKIPSKTVDKSGESGIIKAGENHAIGNLDSDPYEPPYDYETSITDEVKEIFDEEYKLAVERFGEFDTVHGVEVFNDKSTNEGNYNDNSMMVALRHANKKDYLKIVSLIAQQKKHSGMWSTGHQSHVIRHELGHAIQLYHLKNDTNWETKLDKISDIYEKAKHKIDGYEFPSDYSNKVLDEFISECIAASYAKKPSKTVKEVIRIIFKEV